MSNRIPAGAGQYLDEFDGPRFWSHVNLHGGQPYLNDPLSKLTADAGECWTWSGWTSGRGDQRYGRINMFGQPMQAHDIGFMEFGGRIPSGLFIDHLCRNTLCVRHNHVEPVTSRTNFDRGLLGVAARPTCKNGHPFDEENTGWRLSRGRKTRRCLTCDRSRSHHAA